MTAGHTHTPHHRHGDCVCMHVCACMCLFVCVYVCVILLIIHKRNIGSYCRDSPIDTGDIDHYVNHIATELIGLHIHRRAVGGREMAQI